MIRVSEPLITKEDIDFVAETIKNGNLSGRSPVCEEFEKEFAKKIGLKYAIAVNSGTSALFIALKALGIGRGDEVIIPDYCFIAVANAVSHTGAKPIIWKTDDEFNLVDGFEITKKTKAIIVVHTYGYPCDIEKFRKYGLPIIEDCAEALGADGIGTGDISCYSFFANKTITTGEGGMVATNNESLAKEMRLLKDQYRTGQFRHRKIGYGMSLNAMSCALGLSQVRRLDAILKRKREIALNYIQELASIEKIKIKWNDRCSYWMVVAKTDEATFLKNYLLDFDIETRPGFVPIHLQDPYLQGPIDGSFYYDVICLPCGVGLTEKEQTFVIHKIKEYYDKHNYWLR